MSTSVTIVIAVAAATLGIGAGFWLPPHGRVRRRERTRPVRRILLPFTGEAISRRAFEAATRLAKAENATIMPAFLARVPMNLPLDTPVPGQSESGMPLLEAIEQRAAALGIPAESRVARGRSYRDALRHILENEQFDRIIVSVPEDERSGLTHDDLLWLIDRVPAEIMLLRPARTDTRQISGAGMSGHF
ncbi:MAG TPA: universal stress protein [Solirubrobacteraceae bacterium]|nr:universal stress protein [Solirubrobacteraceae bacterium]